MRTSINCSSVSEQPAYRVVLRARPGDRPPIVRLRSLLKIALRAFGLVAVSVEEVSVPDRKPTEEPR